MSETQDSVPLEADDSARTAYRSPAIVGASVALLGFAFWFALEKIAATQGAASRTAVIDGVFVVLLFLQMGYFISVVPLIRQAGQRCLADLRPMLDGADGQLQAVAEQFARQRIPFVHWAWLAGAVLAGVLQEAQFSRFSTWLTSPGPALGELWTVLAALGAWSLGLSAASVLISDAAAIRRLGHDHVAVDLMRVDQLTAFSRYGLQLTGAVVGLMTLWAVSLVLINAFVGVAWSAKSVYVGLLMVLAYVCLSIAAFVFPQLGVRRRIRDKKDAVCDEITSLLPGSGEIMPRTKANPERMAALLSSRNEIRAIPEWPAGQHTRIRLTLYLLVPLLSWSAAALVEEVVSWLLGG
ncbi:MAG: hypothetical protein R3228_09500 [Halioglobus sp.]|nr:hypothetical protein [Halioglobus sp.]